MNLVKIISKVWKKTQAKYKITNTLLSVPKRSSLETFVFQQGPAQPCLFGGLKCVKKNTSKKLKAAARNVNKDRQMFIQYFKNDNDENDNDRTKFSCNSHECTERSQNLTKIVCFLRIFVYSHRSYTFGVRTQPPAF